MRVGRLILTAFTISLVTTSARDATAAAVTANITVSATVSALCTLTATPLTFGLYTSSAALTATANLTVVCTLATPFNVGLDAGQGSGATVSSRKMTFGSNTLSYKLTSDAAHTINIGQTIGNDTLTGSGIASAQILTVYGQIPSGQNVPAGGYSDTVIATITY